MTFQKQDNCTSVKMVVERNTGIDAETFLTPVENTFIKNLDEAVEFVKDHAKEAFSIVGDYDSDGINATTILYLGLKLYGINAKTRLPHRFSEGYGLKENIIDEIPSGVVVTVDNGIAAAPAIRKAKEKGLKVVVIDHHLAPVDPETKEKILPDADIIVDPVTEDESEFDGYCGAALAYRFVQKLLPDANLTQLLVMASIATVSDVMKLHGANRTLLKQGLEAINAGKVLPGLKQLMVDMKLTDHITEDDYGFGIGPVFNASGRLYDNGAERVLATMTSPKNNPQLPWKVAALIKTNNRRKEYVREAMDITVPPLLDGNRPIVIFDPSIGEGIIGIIAGKLTEKYNCPSIVFTESKDPEILKGSGRSIPGYNLKKILDSIQNEMVGYGGHEGAAGLSIRKDNLQGFKNAFAKAVGDLPNDADIVYYDLDLTRKTKMDELMSEIKKFAPYGEGNPKIRLRMKFAINAADYREIGDGSHFMVKGKTMTLMGFGMSKRYEQLGRPSLIDCVGYLTESWFNGKCSYKFELLHFEPVVQSTME